MGSQPLRKASIFDPKLLQINLTSEITVIKVDERNKKCFTQLNIHQPIYSPKSDTKNLINFLYSKFDSLKELSLNDDELDDGNPIEIRKIEIDKKVFPKKNRLVKFSQVKKMNKGLNVDKKTIHRISEPLSCKNDYNIDDLIKKSKSDKNNNFFLHEENFKNPKKSKFYRYINHTKSFKIKDFKKNITLSTIKSKKSECDKELKYDNNDEKTNDKDSLDLIRVLEEMEN